MRCHGHISENLVDEEKLVQFDALSHYNLYTEIFDYERYIETMKSERGKNVKAEVTTCLN